MGITIQGTIQHSKGQQADLAKLAVTEGAIAIIEMPDGRVELRVGDVNAWKDPLDAVKAQLSTLNQLLATRLDTDDPDYDSLQEILDYIAAVEQAVSSGGSVVTWSSVTGKPASFPPAAHDHDSVYLAINGTALAANKLATARTFTLDGAVTGSVAFDGSGNVTLNTSLAVDGIQAPSF